MTDRSEPERVLQDLRAFATAQSELGRFFARHQQMHATDAAAIVEILDAERRGRPVSPARLAGRLGLTTGATSSLLNRLEDAGHIVRTRGHSDRRAVTVHSTAAVHGTADAFFAPITEQLTTVLSTYSAADLDIVADIVERLRVTIDAYTTTMNGPEAAAPDQT